MNLSRFATTGLLALLLFTVGFMVPDAVAQRANSGYENEDSGPDDDDFGGAQQEFERMITPQYRRMGMRVESLPNGSLRLRLPSEVMFAHDSADINRDFMPTLRQVARIMKRSPGVRARIVGHTDSTGPDDYNLELSQRRAESVAALLSSAGVKERRLIIQGRGEQDPVASNATPEGQKMNRRVDIVLLRRDRGKRSKQNN